MTGVLPACPQDVTSDSFIATYVVPVPSLRSGYRHCPLFTGMGARIPHASVFARFEVLVPDKGDA